MDHLRDRPIPAALSAMTIIWERDLGIVHKFLASPTPRVSLVLGKALSAGVRSLVQVGIVYLITWILGVNLNFNPLALLGVLIVVLLRATCFSLFSLTVACLVKTRERFMGIGQLMTMPLFFVQQCHLPHRPHAHLVAGDLSLESTHLSS